MQRTIFKHRLQIAFLSTSTRTRTQTKFDFSKLAKKIKFDNETELKSHKILQACARDSWFGGGIRIF